MAIVARAALQRQCMALVGIRDSNNVLLSLSTGGSKGRHTLPALQYSRLSAASRQLPSKRTKVLLNRCIWCHSTYTAKHVRVCWDYALLVRASHNRNRPLWCHLSALLERTFMPLFWLSQQLLCKSTDGHSCTALDFYGPLPGCDGYFRSFCRTMLASSIDPCSVPAAGRCKE